MTLLDRYVSDFQFSEVHQAEIYAPAADVLKEVMLFDPTHDAIIKTFIGIRELPLRYFPRLTSAQRPMSFDRFCLLEQTPNEVVYGLIGRFWQANYGLIDIEQGADFLAFQQSGVAKLGLNYRVVSDDQGRTTLITETRIFCPDRESMKKMKLYWYAIRLASGLIRRRMLAMVKKHCEKQSVKLN